MLHILFFVYNGPSVPWIVSVNKYQFSLTSQKLCNLPSVMLLQISNLSDSSRFCGIKIHAEMAEKLQVKDWGFIVTRAPVVYDSFFHILSLNMNWFKL